MPAQHFLEAVFITVVSLAQAFFEVYACAGKFSLHIRIVRYNKCGWADESKSPRLSWRTAKKHGGYGAKLLEQVSQNSSVILPESVDDYDSIHELLIEDVRNHRILWND